MRSKNLINEIKSHLIQFIINNDLDKWFLIILHPIQFLNFCGKIKKHTNPNQNFLFFLFKTFKFYFTNKKFIKNNSDGAKILNSEIFEQISAQGKPIIIVMWHHGAFLADELLYQFYANEAGVASNAANFPNMIKTADKMSILSLIKISTLSKNKKIIIFFDGPEGKCNHKIKIMGNFFLIAEGYPFLVQHLEANVVASSMYLNNNQLIIEYHQPFILDNEAKSLTVDQILNKTVEHLTDQLITKYPSQINTLRFFSRYRRDYKLQQNNK